MSALSKGDMSRLQAEVRAQPYPLVFATVSGAHLYGFPSRDSDFDLRGCHVAPLTLVLGLNPAQDTIETSTWRQGVLIEVVTHDVRKYFNLLLKRNGYVLEQIFSPLVVHTTPEHEELKEIARTCITRKHYLHYVGFAESEWKLVQRKPITAKRLLYLYRVLLTGINLMRTGEVEANIVRLNEDFKLPQVRELIDRKVGGKEAEALSSGDMDFHESEYRRLVEELRRAGEASQLPEEPAGRAALNDLLIRLRVRTAA